MNMIVAFCKNRGIGYKNQLPWHIPNELKYFKRKTTHGKKNAIIMGKNTWDSFPKKPLQNRQNIILSSTLHNSYIQSNYENTFVKSNFNDLNNTLDILLNKEYRVWIIGGKSIYDYYINDPKLEKIYVTYINNIFLNDVKFPEIPYNFQLKNTSELFKDNTVTYYHKIYENKNM